MTNSQCFNFLAVLVLLPGFLFNACQAADVVNETPLELGGGIKLELVRIPAGSFKQGSPLTEAKRNADETQREVTITREFSIGKYPVTMGQFGRFETETKYVTEAESGTSGGYGVDNGVMVQKKEYSWRNPGFKAYDNQPVGLVTHGDALAFCAWLAKKTGRAITLPTEAQWEYACRAGTTTRFYNGDEDSAADEIGFHKGNSGNASHAVGSKKANAFELFDMSGNVYEWCLDWYGDYAEGSQSDPVATAPGAKEVPRRVLRGGSFLRDAKNCRSAARYRNDPKSRNADNGFRIVMAVKKLEQEEAAK